MSEKNKAPWTQLTAVADLRDGWGVTVEHGGKAYAVFIQGPEAFVFDNECPHQGAPLSNGRCEGGTVICPRHGWEFSLRDGCFLMNQAVRIGVYPSKVEQGFVWARLS